MVAWRVPRGVVPLGVITPVLWLLGYITAFYILPVSDSLQTGLAVSGVMIALGSVFLLRAPVIHTSRLTYLILALWAVAALSCVMSDVKFISITFLYFFSAFPMTFLLFSMTDARHIMHAVRGVLLALGVSSLIQFFWIPKMLKFGGTHWPFADNNSLGAMLAVGSVLFLGDAFRGNKWKWFYLSAAVLLFAAIMTTEGRAVALVFAGVFALIAVLVRPVPKQIAGVFFLCAMLLLGGMTKSELSIPHWFGEGAQTIKSFEDSSVDQPNMLSGSRFMIWKSTIDIFMDHPLVGTGIGTFFVNYPQYRNPLDDSAGYMAHNDLLQFASEMGFIAPILAMLIVGFVVFKTFQKLKNIDNNDDRLNLIIPFAAFILVTGHSLVNFNFYILPSLMTTGLMLAVWNKQIAQDEIVIGARKQMREICAVGVIFICFIPLWGVSISEYKVGTAMVKLAKLDVAGFSDDLNIADTTCMGLNGRVYLQAAIFARETKDTSRAMMMLDKAEQVNPRIAQVYVERSKILETSDKATALAQARQAMLINPSALTARIQLADMLEHAGQRKDAYDVLKAGMVGMMRNPNPYGYYKRVATMALEFGDLDTNALALERLRP